MVKTRMQDPQVSLGVTVNSIRGVVYSNLITSVICLIKVRNVLLAFNSFVIFVCAVLLKVKRLYEHSWSVIMSDNVIRCDTPGSGSGPSSGSGTGHDSGLGFDEAGYSVAILEKLKEQRDAQQFCDVTIRINGVNFSAHRAVLAACSPYFETLLDGSHIVRQTVVVASRPGGHMAFGIVLQFMYTGISTLSDDIVLDVMKFSERFCMSQLRDRCIGFLQQHMTPSNCFRTKELALGLSLTGLVRVVESYIVANAVDIASAESSVELSHAHLEELIGRLMPLSEIDRVRLIARWAEHKEDRRRRIPALMTTYVQWQKVGPGELCAFLQGCVEKSNCGTALPSDWCLYHVLQSLKDSCLLPDIYFEQLGKLREGFGTDKCTQLTDTCLTNGSIGTSETDDDNDVTVEVENSAEEMDAEDALEFECNTEQVHSCKSRQQRSTPSLKEPADVEEAFDSAVTAAGHVTADLGGSDGGQAACSTDHQQDTQKQKRKRASGQRDSRKQCRLSVNADDDIVPDSQQDDAASGNAAAESLSHERSHSDDNDGTQQKLKTRKLAKKSIKKRKTSAFRNVRCRECQFKAQTVEKLRRHVRTAHRDRQTFFCSVCSFKTRWNRELYRHMATHFAGPRYHCDMCPFTTERIRLLVIHRMDHTDSRPYSCRTCGVRFKMKNNLAAHERCHSGV